MARMRPRASDMLAQASYESARHNKQGLKQGQQYLSNAEPAVDLPELALLVALENTQSGAGASHAGDLDDGLVG